MSTQRLLYVQRKLSTCTLCCFSANKQTILHFSVHSTQWLVQLSATWSYDIFSNAISHEDSGNFRRNMALRAHNNWVVRCLNWKLNANEDWREREEITANTLGHFWTSERKSASFAAIFVFEIPDDGAAARSFDWAERSGVETITIERNWSSHFPHEFLTYNIFLSVQSTAQGHNWSRSTFGSITRSTFTITIKVSNV